MKKYLKYTLYLIISVHLGIIILELIVSINNYIGYGFSNSFIENYAVKHKEELLKGFFKQLMNAILNLIKVSIFMFILYLISNLEFLNTEIDNKEPSITYDNVSIPISTSNETVRNIPEENRVEEQIENTTEGRESLEDNNDMLTKEQSNYSIASKVIYYLGTERNILLFLSYCYIIAEYIRFSSDLKSLFIFPLAPYIYYNMNVKLYKRYRIAKCFFFNLYIGLISLVVVAIYSLIYFEVEKADASILPKEIQEWFSANEIILFVEKIKYDKVNVGIFGLAGFAFLKIFGNWDILTKDEKISVLYHEIGHYVNNSILYRLIIGKSSTIILISLEILLLKLSKFFVSDKITKIGSYFITFILINITILPLITALNNIYFQKDEFEADNFSIGKYNRIYLARSLIKMIFHAKSPFNHSYLYSIFYHTHPTLKRRLENIGVGKN